jgi:hypothetical protein
VSPAPNPNVPHDDDVERTPDELLLELMDLVVLAFPEPLHEMTVTFKPSDDGTRPALTDLDGKARPGTPKRPPLGHDDNAVLDAINALLVEFADATERQGGVRILDGRIAMKDDADGARNVSLEEKLASGALDLVMTRRFDRSELRWLFWTPQLFAALASTEAKEATQRRAVDEALRRQARFDIDMSEGRITFSPHERDAASVPKSPWRFELLGSWNDETKRFLWGWSNEEVAPSLRAGGLQVRSDALAGANSGEGLRALTEESFGCPEPCAERLARHAAARMNAFGVYRAPFASKQGKGFMYLALFTL